jgi:hypothetical protein
MVVEAPPPVDAEDGDDDNGNGEPAPSFDRLGTRLKA